MRKPPRTTQLSAQTRRHPPCPLQPETCHCTGLRPPFRARPSHSEVTTDGMTSARLRGSWDPAGEPRPRRVGTGDADRARRSPEPSGSQGRCRPVPVPSSHGTSRRPRVSEVGEWTAGEKAVWLLRNCTQRDTGSESQLDAGRTAVGPATTEKHASLPNLPPLLPGSAAGKHADKTERRRPRERSEWRLCSLIKNFS